MQTAIIIIIYTVVNLTIIYNGGNNYAVGWLMAFSVDLVIKITKFYSKRKAKHDKYKEWADKLNRGE